ncbi:septum formation protein Maf [Verrucomicrobiota bacterium]|nr:septum formation protein Maf [Verrucomicrobiota bacterium]
MPRPLAVVFRRIFRLLVGVPSPLFLILASASPRRTELLREAGIPHSIQVAPVTEHEDPRTDPREMVLHNARIKAAAVARLHPDALVLGADTTVALGDRALNKPADLAESRAMLRRLSGREHTVHTGICLLAPALGIDEVHDVTAWVRFRSLSDEDITRYQSLVDTLDKAGAYGIQQGKEIIIDDFQRPISTIMGLPVEFVHSRLLALGVLGRLVA